MPELEIVTREIVGPLHQLHVVLASGKTEHRDLEGAEPTERSEKVRPQAHRFIASRGRARASIAPAACFRLDGELAVALIESLAEALAPHRGGRPNDRCSRGHLVGDYPARTMRDKAFFLRS